MNKSKSKNYTKDFKLSSVKLAVESEQPVTVTARNLGLNISTLHTWIKKYHVTKAPIQTPSDPLKDEVKRLRKEVARLTMERDILKKATAYFAIDAA